MNLTAHLLSLALNANGDPTAMTPSQHYVIEGNPRADEYDVKLEPAGDHLELSSTSADGKKRYQATLDSDLRTLSFHSIDVSAGTDARAKVVGGELLVEGRVNGRAVKHAVPIEARAFLHYFNVQLRPFILSDQKRRVFVSLKPDTLKPMQFDAVKEELRVMQVDGAPTRVWVVRIRPTGLFALFWSTRLYFRADDGVFVLDEAKDAAGRPMVSRLATPR